MRAVRFSLVSLAIAVSASAISAHASPGACPNWTVLQNNTTADANHVRDNFNCIQQYPYFTGNVGIGASNPNYRTYIVNPNTENNYPAFYVNNNDPESDFTALFAGASTYTVIKTNGRVGIGTSDPTKHLHVYDSSDNATLKVQSVASGTAAELELQGPPDGQAQIQFQNTGSTRARIEYALASDAMRFSTTTATSYRMTIDNDGDIRFHKYGAGTLTTDASGNITASSDERLKIVKGRFERGLSAIALLDPILYQWNETSGLDTTLVGPDRGTISVHG